MAYYSGKDLVVTVNSKNISEYVTGVEIPFGYDDLDFPIGAGNSGLGSHGHLAGLLNADINLDMHADDAADKSFDVINDNIGSDSAITVTVDPRGSTSGYPRFTMQAVILEMPVPMTVDGKWVMRATLKTHANATATPAWGTVP